MIICEDFISRVLIRGHRGRAPLSSGTPRLVLLSEGWSFTIFQRASLSTTEYLTYWTFCQGSYYSQGTDDLFFVLDFGDSISLVNEKGFFGKPSADGSPSYLPVQTWITMITLRRHACDLYLEVRTLREEWQHSQFGQAGDWANDQFNKL